jgi:tRNA A-37 threonylcarbamoyl transferase component Bud32
VELAAGTRLGPYEIISPLGAGGMGAVYLARHTELHRLVAVKILRDECVDDSRRQRFLREGRSIAKLQHPNIVAIYDFGYDAGRPFLAMEYVDGQTLTEHIADASSRSLDRALPWMEQLCEGLEHAHLTGVIHRDVKPGNLIISTTGVLKILDFGLAQLGAAEALTGSGGLIGTLCYMSPEQVSGQRIDHRADLFAAGAVFYELLTGRRAFQGDSQAAVIHAVIYEDPPPLPEGFATEDLQRILRHALAKDPTERYESARQMRRDLEHVRKTLADSPTTRARDRGLRPLVPAGIEGGELYAREPRRPRPVGMPKVFISYRQIMPDEDCAVRLGAFLEREGFDVFIDKRILVGQNWVEEIDRQIRSAEHFVVLLSAESVRSDMLRQEVADAHALARAGKIRVYPIRLAFDGALPYELGSYLNQLQFVLWSSGEPWDAICHRVLDAIRLPDPAKPSQAGESSSRDLQRLADIADRTGAPLPAADPRLDTGAVELDSPFYVERTADDQVTRLVSAPGRTVLIKGPRQVGKTSLLTRAKGAAERSGHRVVYIDFQLIDEAHLESLKTLATYLAHRIARTLRSTVKPVDVWDDYLGGAESLTDFIERGVLTDTAPVTLCCDEVDRIFDYAYRNAFFAMVRAWHNRRATNAAWKPFGLVVAHSTEPALFIDDVNQSPFNVGEVFRLIDFDATQLGWLNQRHGRPLTSWAELDAFQTLVGGHPYLARQGFYVLATGRVGSLADLIGTAVEDGGPFGDHLRRHLFGLSKRPRIAAAFKAIVRQQRCEDEGEFQRLKAAGLVEGESRRSARVRCDLYQRYFSKHL